MLSVFGFYKGVRHIPKEHAKEGTINTWPGNSFMFALTKKQGFLFWKCITSRDKIKIFSISPASSTAVKWTGGWEELPPVFPTTASDLWWAHSLPLTKCEPQHANLLWGQMCLGLTVASSYTHLLGNQADWIERALHQESGGLGSSLSSVHLRYL